MNEETTSRNIDPIAHFFSTHVEAVYQHARAQAVADYLAEGLREIERKSDLTPYRTRQSPEDYLADD